MADTNLDKLKILLAELFMLGQADLDFGIYRVMNAKRAEVTRFLDHDLLPQVRTELEKIQTGDRAGLETELAKAIQNALALGLSAAEAERAEKVKNLRAQLAATVDVSALENEVLSDLANFFRRYYSGGDFLALRRYKAGVYAIPYEGEEVKLHWANADQYYIKTSEFLRDYTFKLADGKRVHFKLVEADTEADNKKSAAGQERRFILCAADPLLETDGELVIRFEYRPDADKCKQAELNTLAAQQIFAFESGSSRREEAHSNSGEGSQSLLTSAATIKGIRAWLPALAAKAPTEKNPGRTLLEKHLGDYTARNSFDYFIHKDIGGFLRRELDFYIKNEIMHLDNIEDDTVPRVEQYLAKIKAIRAIARKIIDFLEQLENFQKKLWLKKKFVVETNYCVTLDRVAEALYPEIAANDAQRAEWVKLFAIDEICRSRGDETQTSKSKKVEKVPASELGLELRTEAAAGAGEKLETPHVVSYNGGVGYTVPLTVEFLKSNPFLVLDTKFFPAEFKEKLLADNKVLGGAATLDEATDGLLIYGDNFQALNLLQARCRDQVKSIYIDPPYNTELDQELGNFLYRDSYRHSSWIGMIQNRLAVAQGLLHKAGTLFVSIDDNEFHNLRHVADSVFGESNLIGVICWKSRDSVSSDHLISMNHNYHVAYARSKPESEFGGFPLDAGEYSNPDKDPRGPWKPVPLDANKPGGDTQYEIVNPNTGVGYPPPKGRSWAINKADYQILFDDKRISFGTKGTAAPKRKLFLQERLGKGDLATPISIWAEAETTQTGTEQLIEMFGVKKFSYPKPVGLISDLMRISNKRTDALTLDFFGGSGTTGHAVIKLNREDSGKRKYILVEVNDYFDTVLKPRLQKVIYSKDWKDGKPVSREGSSHLFKYLRLESYEDALNNLELKRTEAQDDLLRQHAPLREDYLLRYQLDVESAGNASLLAVAQFANPFAYQLKIATGSVGESRAVNVDLVETFNYLLGLRVSHTDTIRGFKVVTGLNPTGEKTLVIWRNVAEKSNADLDAFFQKQGYNTKDMEFAVIYVNGDNNLENLKRADETWKVRRTEDEFKRLMFDVQDV